MWTPISKQELEALIARQLPDCQQEERRLFAKYEVAPYSIPIHRFGKVEHVFAIAKTPEGVIYYEDVEEGFELAQLNAAGAISEPGCNQYTLQHVLNQLLSRLNHLAT